MEIDSNHPLQSTRRFATGCCRDKTWALDRLLLCLLRKANNGPLHYRDVSPTSVPETYPMPSIVPLSQPRKPTFLTSRYGASDKAGLRDRLLYRKLSQQGVVDGLNHRHPSSGMWCKNTRAPGRHRRRSRGLAMQAGTGSLPPN